MHRYAPSAAPSRSLLFFLVCFLELPLCLPRELLQLRFTSSLSVIAMLFTCACIVSLALAGSGARAGGDSDSDAAAAPEQPPGGWLLAMPIFSLAYCSQFNVLDLADSLPKSERSTMLPQVVHLAMGGAFAPVAAATVANYVADE